MTEKNTASKEVAVHIGDVAVDSGMVMIVDPCRAAQDEKSEVDYDKAIAFMYSTDSIDLDCTTCKTAAAVQARKTPAGKNLDLSKVLNRLKPHLHRQLTPEEHQQIGFGVVSSTGIGDGLYPVYAVVYGRQILRLEIDFQQ
jgi:hypothetical protein